MIRNLEVIWILFFVPYNGHDKSTALIKGNNENIRRIYGPKSIYCNDNNGQTPPINLKYFQILKNLTLKMNMDYEILLNDNSCSRYEM